MTTAYVLVDGPVEGDFRLMRSIEQLAGVPEVFDISTSCPPAPGWTPLRSAGVAWLVVRALAVSLPRTRRILAALGRKNATSPFAGLRACLRWLQCAAGAAAALRVRPGFQHASQVHVHDLYCGVAALRAGLPAATPLVYDSHEFQIHRNRATGLLRILIEAGLEQLVLRRADEVHVVNNAIAQVMRKLHQMPPRVSIRLNDFYAHHPSAIAPAEVAPAVVYVGKGVRGRRLELLDRPAQALGFDVFTYFLGSTLPAHIDGRHWHQGPVEYHEPLLQLVRSRRCMMWCCLDPASLSYQLATPNKLFQALALGLPIIASPGTYLAQLVQEHGIGVVVDETDLPALAAAMRSPRYEAWVERVHAFRAGLQDGSVVI